MTAQRHVHLVRFMDTGFAAAVFMLSSDAFMFLGLHSPLWLLCYGYCLLRLSMHFRLALQALAENWVFLLFPAISLFSILWSAQPSGTIRFSVQLAMTVLMAVFIGQTMQPRRILMIFGGVMTVAMLASLMNISGIFPRAYDHRGYFQGIFISKNALGHRAVLFAITCVFAAFILPRVPLRLRFMYIVMLAFTAFMVSISGSATSMLLCVVAPLTALALWVAMGWRDAWLALLGMIALAIAVTAGLVGLLRIDPMNEVLNLVGRDASLTGRTVLWDFGWRYYLQEPWLGYGANGFWTDPRFANSIIALQTRYGDGVVGFHNLTVELLVMLGPVGLVAHYSQIIVALRRAFFHARNHADPVAVWAIAIIIANFAMAQLGAQLYQPHAIPLILIVALGVSFGPVPSVSPRRHWITSGRSARAGRPTARYALLPEQG